MKAEKRRASPRSAPRGRTAERGTKNTMKHPEFLLVPVFMFADYFLTLAGAVLKDRKYGDHFKAEHYELNPIWQKNVARKKWLNPRQIVLVVVSSSILILPMEFVEMPQPFIQAVLGCLLAVLGMVIGRHLSNLMIFRHVIRKPEEISGQVTMSHALLLWVSLYQYLTILVPLALIAIFSPSPFVIGACVRRRPSAGGPLDMDQETLETSKSVQPALGGDAAIAPRPLVPDGAPIAELSGTSRDCFCPGVIDPFLISRLRRLFAEPCRRWARTWQAQCFQCPNPGLPAGGSRRSMCRPPGRPRPARHRTLFQQSCSPPSNSCGS